MSTAQTQRQEWMAALALADLAQLHEAWEGLSTHPKYRIVRGPETGLVMVRARAGNTGQSPNSLWQPPVPKVQLHDRSAQLPHTF